MKKFLVVICLFFACDLSTNANTSAVISKAHIADKWTEQGHKYYVEFGPDTFLAYDSYKNFVIRGSYTMDLDSIRCTEVQNLARVMGEGEQWFYWKPAQFASKYWFSGDTLVIESGILMGRFTKSTIGIYQK